MDIVVEDIILVCQKVFGTMHKIEDRCEVPIYLVLEKHDDGMMCKVKRIGDSSEESCKNLHRSILYPFMSVYGEESDEEGQEMISQPSKSLSVTAILQESNLEMESHFRTI